MNGLISKLSLYLENKQRHRLGHFVSQGTSGKDGRHVGLAQPCTYVCGVDSAMLASSAWKPETCEPFDHAQDSPHSKELSLQTLVVLTLGNSGLDILPCRLGHMYMNYVKNNRERSRP